MSDKNRKIRLELERIYGKGCMFQKAKLAERLEKLGIDPTYKKFKETRRYTRKEIQFYETQMNLHHLKHKADGGETTIENGAVINTIAHQYIHHLPRDKEEIANNMLREYKKVAFTNVDYLDQAGLDLKIAELAFETPKKKKDIKRIERDKEERNKRKEIQKLKKEFEDR